MSSLKGYHKCGVIGCTKRVPKHKQLCAECDLKLKEADRESRNRQPAASAGRPLRLEE